MSEVKVNKVSPRSGTNVQLGDSGDTITIPSGVTFDASSGGLAGTLTTAAQPNITSVGTLTSFTSTGIDDNATSTAITIDSSENVGIGTTSTQGRLLIKTNTSGFTSDPSLISSGNISFSNSSGGTALPTIMGRSDNNGGLQLMGATSNAPSVADMIFDIRENDNTNYATTTGYGFRFSRYGSELMRLTRDGKLGIGTSSPGFPLQINSSAQTTLLHLVSTAGTSSQITFANTGSNDSIAIGAENDDLKLRTDDGVIKFFTNENSEKMRIDTSGNVGINTTSPSQKLHVNGHIVSNGLNLANNTSSPPSGTTIHQPSSNVMAFRTSSVERMRITDTEVVVNDASNDVDFRVESNGISSMFLVNGADDKIYINASSSISGGSGYLQIQNNYTRTAIDTKSNNTAPHHAITFHNPNGQVGQINTDGSGVTFTSNSDYRLKENVNYDFDATTRLKQLKPARFNFKADTNKIVDGFIAHEVSSVVPEAIHGTKDAVDEDGNPKYQGIDQSKLVPLLVKTIQELEARITQLENA